ncbi:LysR family transcriptional regulator [Burkholderia stagnalis]|uniref:LysR family transcriptional regulator n=1 Tax=Burkholderia stagnalis TaxID=1503054 RepID=A0A6L3MY15_9BURK|nr:LysR family transcriptional regulator [Burkholderia stagnalis]KAB0637077.1 LysR family transcriptional regulator [Burkholderia stagnalis]KVO36373.1 LysR family transcriptional regulator [Burkholderia stagnalis]KVO73844.1 LysR family transcriptional regulator [Burkholderia stagnalis]KVW65354.1 LysR family transcriptional regulator [Burkholderia stagnalis]KVW77607.1 LysR family transcriptional regulator [Burkholderia stagnalis]
MLNFRHLYYFWVVVKEGGFARAAERLDMAVQTISAQVRELEKALGHQLLGPAGRGVALTDAGQAAFARAEAIFELGRRIPDEVRAAASRPTVRLAVGLSDGISKLAAHAILAPVLDTPALRLLCHEGEHDALLAELALHHLDLVLAGQAAPPNANLRVTSERLVASPVDWYGPAALVTPAARQRYPQCLAELPLLLPTAHSALRERLDRWLETARVTPRIVGEFEDSALMAVFAARGLGVFPLSELGANDASMLRGLRRLGRAGDVTEEIHAIRSRRGEHHPLTAQLLAVARDASRT